MASTSKVFLRNTTTRVIRMKVGQGPKGSGRELVFGGVDDHGVVGAPQPVVEVTKAEHEELKARRVFQGFAASGVIEVAA